MARALGLLVLIVCGSAPLAADEPVVTSIQQFWDLTPAQKKSQTHQVELACTVTYFDPEWRILFVQDDAGGGAYVPYGDNPYPFKAGEAILVRGEFHPPNVDVSFEHVTVTPRSGPRVPALDATDPIREALRFDNRYVVLEGFVDRFRRSDETHLQLQMSVNGESVLAWVLMPPKEPTPDLAERRIRLEGVYNPKLAPDGALTSLELMVTSTDKITPLAHLSDEPAFQMPLTPISALPNLSSRQQVHVRGAVVAREPGRYLRIRDAGGQVDLMTGQMRPVLIGETVEAIGYPVVNGLEWHLKGAVFRGLDRSAAPPPAASGGIQTIGLANDVMRLSADEAAQGYPVRLTGVVTWSHNKSPFFFLQDSSGGVCVMRGQSTSLVRSPGRRLEVQGVSGVGGFAPVVIATAFDRIGEAIVPVARHISIEHAMTGIEEAQWVEMRGYLREIVNNGDWRELKIATGTTDFTAIVPATEDLSSMVGSVVRLHGVCTAETDSRRKLIGIKLRVPGAAYVQVEEPALKDPFSVPVRSLATLGQFETVQSFNRRVHVAGTVLRHVPGRSISIAEGGHSLLILTSERMSVQPGDRLQAVGFLGRQGGRITLSEAVCRVTGHGPQPSPIAVEPGDAPSPELDGQLVTIKGTLLGGAAAGEFVQFTVQAARKIFEVSLEAPAPGETFALPESGSRVALTGVYAVGYDERSQADSFGLRLRSADDIVILETPSWWTRARLLAFTGVIALGALLFLAWITVLRRQVQRQTDQIRQQVARESRLQAELARAGKLDSLGLLAGGIAHDFNNLLTVLIGNMSLLRLDATLGPDSARSLAQAEKAAARARDLTQQLLTFAKGGAPLRTAVSLSDAVREVAEFAVRGSKVRCEFAIPPDLWPANVDKGQIGQVVQNIVLNAVQAMPDGGVLDVALFNHEVGTEFAGVLVPGRYVRLDFTDHGPGIAKADLARIFDPYFTTKQKGSGLGLATVHSIVKKHGGHVTAESVVGAGTTFHVWLPAAEVGSPVKPDSAPAIPPPAVVNRSARVLLLDDEQFIQELACSILRRYGYESTAVADGQAAIAEYERARQDGRPYDLVILDLTIPGGMGGRQTLEELLKLDPAVKAIVSSGYSNDLVLANYQAHGFRGMVSKPYDVADFAQTVARVLKGERA